MGWFATHAKLPRDVRLQQHLWVLLWEQLLRDGQCAQMMSSPCIRVRTWLADGLTQSWRSGGRRVRGVALVKGWLSWARRGADQAVGGAGGRGAAAVGGGGRCDRLPGGGRARLLAVARGHCREVAPAGGRRSRHRLRRGAGAQPGPRIPTSQLADILLGAMLPPDELARMACGARALSLRT